MNREALRGAEELGREAQHQIDRKLTGFHDEDGMLVVKARLPAEAGQMFIKAIEAACEEIPAAETPADVSAATPNVKWRVDPSARKVDALANWHQLVATHVEQGIHIDRDTAAARLHGDGYDHGMAVDSLLRRARTTESTRPVSVA